MHAPSQLHLQMLTESQFMQRAAAATPLPPSSPAASTHATDTDTPSPKRQKKSHTPTNGSQNVSETELIRRAIAAEEVKREEALARHEREGGETRWVLSTHDAVGKKDEDEEDEDEDGEEEDTVDAPWRTNATTGGRLIFGKWKSEVRAFNPTLLHSKSCGCDAMPFMVHISKLYDVNANAAFLRYRLNPAKKTTTPTMIPTAMMMTTMAKMIAIARTTMTLLE
jgi:hypothetical protein